MIKSTFDAENQLITEGYKFIIGIDEAGRGPLAGPVVACAVALRNYESGIMNQENETVDLIRDSKTLSHKQREGLFDFIHEHFYVGLGICDHETIDRVNILEATFLAMKKAVASLARNSQLATHNSKSIILLDGNKKIPNLSMEQKTVVNGDKFVKSISAASIIAKVTRDCIMLEMHAKYPEYNFAKHKGYGTKLHMEALINHGPCEIHRRSFKPVEKLAKAKN